MDIDHDKFQSIGDIAADIVNGLSRERKWDGASTITESGIWSNIPLEDYHQKIDLLDGPSISKSSVKWLLPAHGGSPKAFWGRWAHNPKRVEQKSSDALDFGKATHALLLGDEVFADKFIVRPNYRPEDMQLPEKERRQWNANANDCKAFLKEAADRKLTVISQDQYDRIVRIHADASQHPLVRNGILNGKIERSMFWKDPETGIWLKARPDALPNVDGVFADLKTTSSFAEDFLERQLADAGYYLQAAMTRMVCRGLGIPFETFAFVYVLNDDVPDTTVVEINELDINRGEKVIRWALKTIRHCLDTGEWPGARPFNDGNRTIHMKEWVKTRLDEFLEREAA